MIDLKKLEWLNTKVLEIFFLRALHVNKSLSSRSVLSGQAHSKSLLGLRRHKCEQDPFEHGLGT